MDEEKKSWRDTFKFECRCPEGKPRFEKLVPGYRPSKTMGPAMAYMYTAVVPITGDRFRVTFATTAEATQEEADKLGFAMMERKIRKHYLDIAEKLVLAC